MKKGRILIAVQSSCRIIVEICSMKILNLFPCNKLIVLSIILLFCSIGAIAGKEDRGHLVSVRIVNCTDTLFYLNHYSMDGIINDDTARKNQDGAIVFRGPDTLETGMYFVSSNVKPRYFDFFIGTEQNLTFEFEWPHMIRTMKTTGSVENRNYFKTLLALQSHVPGTALYNDSIEYLVNHAAVSDSTMKHLLGSPNDKLSFSEKYLKACILPSVFQQIQFKKPGEMASGSIRFYLDHFFDNLDFSDYPLANTAVFTRRIDEFIDTITALRQFPMQAEVDHLIALSSANQKTMEFVTWYLLTKFETYYFLPGYDALFVHIVNDFLETGKVAWFYPEVKSRELNALKKMEPLLNGKIVPDLEMPDTNAIFRELYAVKSKYTLLLFWASTCSHCRDEMPAILKLYDDFHLKYNFELFAVSTDTSISRWKSYVRRHKLPWVNVFGRKNTHGSYHDLYNIQSTPTLFLLDDKKAIIEKYILTDKVREIIINNEVHKRKK